MPGKKTAKKPAGTEQKEFELDVIDIERKYIRGMTQTAIWREYGLHSREHPTVYKAFQRFFEKNLGRLNEEQRQFKIDLRKEVVSDVAPTVSKAIKDIAVASADIVHHASKHIKEYMQPTVEADVKVNTNAVGFMKEATKCVLELAKVLEVLAPKEAEGTQGEQEIKFELNIQPLEPLDDESEGNA